MTHTLPVTGRRVTYCNCGRLVFWDELMLTRIVYLQPVSQNRFLRSRYHGDFWGCDGAIDVGRISQGPFLHEYTITYDKNNVPTESGGSQTWMGSGIVRTTVGIDCAATDRIVFAADVGPYHRSESPLLEISSGVCNADASTMQTLRSVTTSTQLRVWARLRMADLHSELDASSLYFFFSVTPQGQGRWYVDRMQLEFGVDSLGPHVPTTGIELIYPTPTRRSTVARTCKACRSETLRTRDTVPAVESAPSPIPVAIDVGEV